MKALTLPFINPISSQIEFHTVLHFKASINAKFDLQKLKCRTVSIFWELGQSFAI